jgi:hypothetical protein
MSPAIAGLAAKTMEDLKIRLKCEDMIKYAYGALKQFPKSEKFSLAAEIKTTMLGLLRRIVVCNKRYYKKTTMQEMDADLDLLRSQVRLAKDLGFLPFGKYEVWSRMIDEIGRMVGGWMKSLK